MKKWYLIKPLGVFLLLLITYPFAHAQLSMTAQYRTRSEFRAGQGTLPLRGDAPAFFTSQRMRLGIGYTMDRLKFYTALQDVRDWGQDGSTISNADGKNFFIHEAWGEIIFSDSNWQKIADNFSLKVGRQEIVYDDQRLLGNLDWLQQGRRHDAAILKWNKRYWFVDIGAAYNQNREAKSSAFYDGTTTNPNFTGAVTGSNGLTPNYKAFYFLYIRRNLGWGNASLLSFNDDFAKGPNGTNLAFSNAVYSRHTFGGNLTGKALRKIDFNAYGYYQTGKDNKGNSLSAYTYGAGFMALVSRKFSVGPGFDLMSGNNTVKSQYNVDGKSNNQAFDPLYGTPHKFWGFMDYFYTADGYGNYAPAATGLGNSSSSILSPGLVNAFLKFRYKLVEKVNLSLDVHEFWAQNKVANRATAANKTDELNKNLGTELDFLVNWNLTPAIGFEAGYSAMFGTNTLDALKHSGATGSAARANRNDLEQRNVGHWAYLMINVRPDLMADLNVFKRDSSRKIDELSKKLDELSNKMEGVK
ncbi:MAG TPA: alginate export family protein [Cytophagaceae bacterium]|nr:alginate export family protein [Cytophagaceae bacterium]